MALDGIAFLGQTLKLRRPKDYQGDAQVPVAYVPGVISSIVPDGPNKIFVGGLPLVFSEDQIKELLQEFGSLRAFNLVTEGSTGKHPAGGFRPSLRPRLASRLAMQPTLKYVCHQINVS